MKRIAIKLVVFLLLGAVVNVAVAWGCAVWSPLPAYDWRKLELGMPNDLVRLVPEHWLRPTSQRAIRLMQSSNFDLDVMVWQRTEDTTGVGLARTLVEFHKYNGAFTIGFSHGLLRHSAGWPCLSLSGVCVVEQWLRGPIDGHVPMYRKGSV